MGDGENPRIGLVVMAKAPIPGEAKTRLAASLGGEAAASIYRAFLLDTVAVFDELAATRGAVARILICPDQRHAARLAGLVGAPWSVLAQARAGLMGGIVDGFEAAFARDADLVVVSDADSPLTLYEHLDACLVAGAEHDLALGPTLDGGYYLVTSRRGASPRLADVFLTRRYDSATICAETAKQVRALGLSVGFGPTGFDVDTQNELSALAEALDRVPPAALVRTRAQLAWLDESFAVAAS
jgi:glycosyltransferase A (GT-A) superfamily protein (DUF2064 family)